MVGMETVSACLEVDFANMRVGGGVLHGGCVQEEIRFSICPENLLACLLCPAMLPNEAIQVFGAQQYSAYSGYASSLRFAGGYRHALTVAGDEGGRATGIEEVEVKAQERPARSPGRGKGGGKIKGGGGGGGGSGDDGSGGGGGGGGSGATSLAPPRGLGRFGGAPSPASPNLLRRKPGSERSGKTKGAYTTTSAKQAKPGKKKKVLPAIQTAVEKIKLQSTSRVGVDVHVHGRKGAVAVTPVTTGPSTAETAIFAVGIACINAIDGRDYKLWEDDPNNTEFSLAVQLQEQHILQELNKAVAGFTKHPGDPFTAISTGNWGAGVFKGNAELKAVLQWMAASVCGRPIRYFPYDQELLGAELVSLATTATATQATVGALWGAVTSYIPPTVATVPNVSTSGSGVGGDKSNEAGDRLIPYVLAALKQRM
jgi:hypothetical protein